MSHVAPEHHHLQQLLGVSDVYLDISKYALHIAHVVPCNSCWGLAHIYLDTSTDNFCSLCLLLKEQGIHLLPAGALQPDFAQHWLHELL